jgi:hypothetical protein
MLRKLRFQMIDDTRLRSNAVNHPVPVDLFLLGLRLSPTGRVTLPALGGLETRIGDLA